MDIDNNAANSADSTSATESKDTSTTIATEPESSYDSLPIAIIDDTSAECDDELYQSNASKRRAQFQKEGISQQEKYRKKLTLTQWISDFFFHNKFECIAAIAIIAIIAVIAVFNIEKSYDYNIAVYTYEIRLTRTQIEHLEDIFVSYGEDVDGDGHITVNIENYRPYAGWYIPRFIASQKLYDDIYGERTTILIITDEQCRDNITERYSDYHFESLSTDTKWISLAGTAFCPDENIPVELGLMMFRPGSYAMDIADVQKRHGHAEDIIEKIADDYPELF